MEDHLHPQEAAAWCKDRGLPAIAPTLRRELVRIAKAVQQAIYEDEELIPREVRVYYQALKYISTVAGAPEGKQWYRNP